MRELLYIEIPTPQTEQVLQWLHQSFGIQGATKTIRPDGIRLTWNPQSRGDNPSNDPGNNPGNQVLTTSVPTLSSHPGEFQLSVFIWSVQRTTYLKVFRWSNRAAPHEAQVLATLSQGLSQAFPPSYPAPPVIDLGNTSIFTALEAQYPKTVQYFRQIPNGEADLTRAYWWEQRWREGVKNPQQPKLVVFLEADSPDDSPRTHLNPQPPNDPAAGNSAQGNSTSGNSTSEDPTPNSSASPSPTYDLIYIGGALGVIHAVMMAKLGYRVLLIERLAFGRMNREWNISRDEFQSLIDLGLFSPEEFEAVIAREYVDGFHKFFDANNPPQAKAEILRTPTVLNIAINSDQLLQHCGEKLRALGGEIWDRTEFQQATISPQQVTVQVQRLENPAESQTKSGTESQVRGRLLIDAMGTASPIAWQLNQGRPFDSVCPTVGAVFEGLDAEVWDHDYGDVLNSHGDTARGRQLIWELFPAQSDELTVYLFHYHQIHPDNPGSLLEMYEDFFAILPEYRRCDLDKLTWKKATFGYIPGYFSRQDSDRQVAFDRLMAIGDAASLQSPLIFTGFGSLVRNLSRLTDLLDTALKHDLLSAAYLNRIRAYQSNVSVTWLFSKGMMVPTGRVLPPERINAMLNTFFGILASESPQVSDAFMKDRADWISFNRMALKAAWINPALLAWIWDLAGFQDGLRWLGSYFSFTLFSLLSWLLAWWFPPLLRQLQPWLEPRYPALWFWLLVQSYQITDGVGRPQWRASSGSS
jgi:lycopene cyclase CruA